MTARHIPIRAILALALVCGACASAPPSNDQVTASDLSSTSAQPHLGTTSTATAPSSTVGPLTTISTSRPTTAESEPDYTSRSGGCFDGPAWPGEYVDIPQRGPIPANLLPISSTPMSMVTDHQTA